MMHELWCRGTLIKRGQPTKAALRVNHVRRALKIVGMEQAALASIDAPWLLRVQALFASSRELDYCRTTVNEYVRIIVAAAHFAATQNIGSAGLYERLRLVDGLRKGRPPAPGMRPPREPRRREPPPRAWVQRVRRELPPHPRLMLDLQLITGMRPSEVCAIRPCDLSDAAGRESGGVMVYRVPGEANKTEHDERAHEKLVFLGPRAMRVLRMVWPEQDDEHFFQPAISDRLWRQSRSAARITPRFKSHALAIRRARRRAAGARPAAFGPCYTADSYRRALERACRRARQRDEDLGVPERLRCGVFSPYQLRHARATHLTERAGLFVAQQMLGHKDPRTTLRYVKTREQFMAKHARLLG